MSRRFTFSLALSVVFVAASSSADPSADSHLRKIPEKKTAYRMEAYEVDGGWESEFNTYSQAEPLRGPYITEPAGDHMRVTWISEVPVAGGAEFREVNGKPGRFEQVWHTHYGVPEVRSRVHSVLLTGLKPGSEYEYRLISAPVTYQNWWKGQGIVSSRRSWTFRTLDPDKKEAKFFLASDMHGSADQVLEAQITNTGASDADLFVMAGDMVGDSLIQAELYIFRGFLNEMIRLFATSRPLVISRGNHDAAGSMIEAVQWGDFFPTSNQKSYGTIMHGGVLFIIFDSMKPSASNVESAAFGAYKREQKEWFCELSKTDLYRNAKFRVPVIHWAYSDWRDLFEEAPEDGRIHLFVVGHEHHYIRTVPGELATKIQPPAYTSLWNTVIMPYKIPHPYTHPMVMLENLWGCATITVKDDKLDFHAFMNDGATRDHFTIDTDGNVTDIGEYPVFEPPATAKSVYPPPFEKPAEPEPEVPPPETAQ